VCGSWGKGEDDENSPKGAHMAGMGSSLFQRVLEDEEGNCVVEAAAWPKRSTQKWSFRSWRVRECCILMEVRPKQNVKAVRAYGGIEEHVMEHGKKSHSLGALQVGRRISPPRSVWASVAPTGSKTSANARSLPHRPNHMHKNVKSCPCPNSPL